MFAFTRVLGMALDDDMGLFDGIINNDKDIGTIADELSEAANVAIISVLITDQGNGGTYCGHCNYDLDPYLSKRLNERLANPDKEPAHQQCPKCTYLLKDDPSGPYINSGGSDF